MKGLGISARWFLPVVLAVVSTGCSRQEFPSARTSERQRLLEDYDTDGDGRLNASEREVIRRRRTIPYRFQEESESLRRAPGHVLAAYDENRDGGLDDSEYERFLAEERRKAEAYFARFDRDGNGRLTGEERVALLEAVETDDVEIPALIDRMLRQFRRGWNRRSNGPEDDPFARFDRDGDGRLNEEEHRDAVAAQPRWR